MNIKHVLGKMTDYPGKFQMIIPVYIPNGKDPMFSPEISSFIFSHLDYAEAFYSYYRCLYNSLAPQYRSIAKIVKVVEVPGYPHICFFPILDSVERVNTNINVAIDKLREVQVYDIAIPRFYDLNVLWQLTLDVIENLDRDDYDNFTFYIFDGSKVEIEGMKHTEETIYADEIEEDLDIIE